MNCDRVARLTLALGITATAIVLLGFGGVVWLNYVSIEQITDEIKVNRGRIEEGRGELRHIREETWSKKDHDEWVAKLKKLNPGMKFPRD